MDKLFNSGVGHSLSRKDEDMNRFRPYLPTMACLLALTVTGFVACAPAEEPVEEEIVEEAVIEEEEPMAAPATAVAYLRPAGDVALAGEATFTEENGSVTLNVAVSDAPPGVHGFHVHETGSCEAPDFTSAGGHFNPDGTDHACPPTTPRHGGDFGNIEIGENGSGTLAISSDLVTVADGPSSLIGRAVILHEATDDCASQPTGAAGARLACGVIESGGGSVGEPMGEPMEEPMEEPMDELGDEPADENGGAY